MRTWNVEVYLVNEADQSLIPANIFDKVQYKLHESFGKRATQGEFIIIQAMESDR